MDFLKSFAYFNGKGSKIIEYKGGKQLDFAKREIKSDISKGERFKNTLEKNKAWKAKQMQYKKCILSKAVTSGVISNNILIFGLFFIFHFHFSMIYVCSFEHKFR